MRRIMLMALLVALLGVAACGGATTVTDEDDGSTVTLSVGDELVVKLEANRTTPYTLGLGDVPKQLELVSAEYDQDFAFPGQTGVGGNEVWEFTAVKPGNGTIVVEMHGEFYEEGSDTPTQGTEPWWSLDVVVGE